MCDVHNLFNIGREKSAWKWEARSRVPVTSFSTCILKSTLHFVNIFKLGFYSQEWCSRGSGCMTRHTISRHDTVQDIRLPSRLDMNQMIFTNMMVHSSIFPILRKPVDGNTSDYRVTGRVRPGCTVAIFLSLHGYNATSKITPTEMNTKNYRHDDICPLSCLQIVWSVRSSGGWCQIDRIKCFDQHTALIIPI
jgi:hypothetical protein